MNNIIKCDINNNKILGNNPTINSSIINFKGKNNILFCEENVILYNSTLNFNGNNSIIYLSSNKHKYILNIDIYNNSILFLDENNYMNGKLNIILSEMKNVIIGKDCLFSFGIYMRLADPHLIYDIETKTRKNLSKSIFIGDHVWIGKNSMILKGTHIGSGSIIGAMSVVSNKQIASNTIWGGNPAKELKRNVFFLGDCVHRYTEKETNEKMLCNSDKYIYKENGEIQDFNKIDEKINSIQSIEEKIDF